MMHTAILQKVPTSLLQRLCDEQPDQPSEVETKILMSIAELQQDIRRNLEGLLNSRKELTTVNSRLHAVTQSILYYGIEDFTQLKYSLREQQQALCLQLRQAIHCFEPRLQQVDVELLSKEEAVNRRLYLRISGVVQLRPMPKNIAFETSLDIVKHTFHLNEE